MRKTAAICGRYAETPAGDEGEQLGEHPAGGPRTTPEPDEELTHLAFQPALVDRRAGRIHHRHQRVGRTEAGPTVDGEDQHGQGFAGTVVEPSDGAEVEQLQLAVGAEQDVARMEVGVEDPADHDLPQDSPEQPIRQFRALLG